MGRKWDSDETGTEMTMEPQIAAIHVEGGEVHDEAKLYVDFEFTVTEPREWIGTTLNKRFFLGTDEDPGADEPATRRNRNWKRYNRFLLDFIGTKPAKNLDENIEQARGTEGLAFVGIREFTRKDGTPGSVNDIKAFYRLGSRDLGPVESLANGKDRTAGRETSLAATARAAALGTSNAQPAQPTAATASRRAMELDDE